MASTIQEHALVEEIEIDRSIGSRFRDDRATLAPIPAIDILDKIDEAQRRGARVLLVTIESLGGQVDESVFVYFALRAFSRDGGAIVVHLKGRVCSTAPIVALAGDYITMDPAAELHLHSCLGHRAAESNREERREGDPGTPGPADHGSRPSRLRGSPPQAKTPPGRMTCRSCSKRCADGQPCAYPLISPCAAEGSAHPPRSAKLVARRREKGEVTEFAYLSFAPRERRWSASRTRRASRAGRRSSPPPLAQYEMPQSRHLVYIYEGVARAPRLGGRDRPWLNRIGSDSPAQLLFAHQELMAG